MKIQNGMLQGSLDGRPVTCVLRPGITIPAGQYMLLPATPDPIYGDLVQMVRVGGAGSPDMSSSQRERVAWGPAPFARSGMDPSKMSSLSPASNAAQFVLSAKAMPGRNNVVVNFGFSDLVEALKLNGGDGRRCVKGPAHRPAPTWTWRDQAAARSLQSSEGNRVERIRAPHRRIPWLGLPGRWLRGYDPAVPDSNAVRRARLVHRLR